VAVLPGAAVLLGAALALGGCGTDRTTSAEATTVTAAVPAGGQHNDTDEVELMSPG